MMNALLHRHHGRTMLHKLADHKNFRSVWTKIVPDKERHPLEKILRKAM